jgi:DNA-binding MarR family transcriptional regulator
MPETGAPGTSVLFLREEQMRQAQDMLFLAWRDFAGSVDPVLEARGLGRAHHRALHFIGRQPDLTVTDLLGLLSVTKQSLSRTLGTLVAQDLVQQAQGRSDRRQKRLRLTEAGVALERALFDRQRERLLAAYREAGGAAVEGFRQVMRGLMGHAARQTLDGLHTPAPATTMAVPARMRRVI